MYYHLMGILSSNNIVKWNCNDDVIKFSSNHDLLYVCLTLVARGFFVAKP